MDLKDYMEKQKAKEGSHGKGKLVIHRIVEPDTKRARQMGHWYNAFSKEWGKHTQVRFEKFKAVVAKVEEHERNTGVSVNDMLFIRSHFKVFGIDNYPERYLGKTSMTIYNSFMKGYRKPIQERRETVQEMFDYIQKIWDITEEEFINIFGWRI